MIFIKNVTTLFGFTEYFYINSYEVEVLVILKLIYFYRIVNNYSNIFRSKLIKVFKPTKFTYFR